MSLRKEGLIYEYIFRYIISLKLYHNEVGTEDIGLLVTRADVQQVFLSKLARIEFASTVWKRVRMRNLTAEEAKAVIKEFNRNAIKYEFYEVSP